MVLPTINFVLSSDSALTYIKINVLLSNFNPMGRDLHGEGTTLVSGQISNGADIYAKVCPISTFSIS